jgi:hypothetical protein
MRMPSVLFRNLIGAAASVNHHRQSDRSVIAIRFKNPNTAVRSFYLGGKSAEKGAYRLIMDLYPPGSAATGPGTLIPAASAKADNPAPTPAPDPAAARPHTVAQVSERRLPAAPSSQQLAEILPKALETEPASQAVKVESPAGKQKEEIHPAEPPPRVRPQGKKETFMNTPPPERVSQASVPEQLLIRNEFRDGKDEQMIPSTVGQQKPLRAQERSGSISPGIEEAGMKRQAVPYERKRPISKQKSIGLVELALKLMSIALSCLVILFLHRANKIAAHRYDALRQSRPDLGTRQYR